MSSREQIRWQDIEGLRVGRFGAKINTTSILWRLGSTIIDTGPPNQWASVRHFLNAQPVEQVIVTHHHEDHAGNLSRFPGAGVERMLAPPESLEFLHHGFPLQLYRRIVWGRPGRVAPEAFSGKIACADGSVLDPILLPGHSPDMTCLLDRERGVLFGADVYVGSRLRYLRLDENLNGIISGLEHILRFDFDTLLCSHRGIVSPAHGKLRQKLKYLLELRESARSLEHEVLGVERIVRLLLGPEEFLSHFSFGHFSKTNLIHACLDSAGSATRQLSRRTS